MHTEASERGWAHDWEPKSFSEEKRREIEDYHRRAEQARDPEIRQIWIQKSVTATFRALRGY
jgi:hypothetical protein